MDARLELKEYAAYLKAGNDQSYDEVNLFWFNSFSMDFMGSEYYWSKRRPPNTLSLAPDPKLDAMVEELWGTQDPEKHKQLARQLQLYTA